MANLIAEEMAEVLEIFNASVLHSISNYVGETKQQVVMFVNEIVLREKPYILVSEEGLPRAIELVFSDDHIRDFIFTLHYIFFSRWGYSEEKLNGLINNLARGSSLKDEERVSDLIAIPNEIISRLPSHQDVYDLLSKNRWLVILLLILLSITANIPSDSKKK